MECQIFSKTQYIINETIIQNNLQNTISQSIQMNNLILSLSISLLIFQCYSQNNPPLQFSTACNDPNCLLCKTDLVTCYSCGEGYVALQYACHSTNAAAVANTVTSGVRNVSQDIQDSLNSITTCEDPNCRLCYTDGETCFACGEGFFAFNYKCTPSSLDGVVNVFNNAAAGVQNSIDSITTCNDPNCRLCKTDGVSCLSCGDNYVAIQYDCVPTNLTGAVGIFNSWIKVDTNINDNITNVTESVSNATENATNTTESAVNRTQNANNTTQTNCPILCQECSDNATCTRCNIGYFIDQNQLCQECELNCDSCTDAKTCLVCVEGFTLQQIQTVSSCV